MRRTLLWLAALAVINCPAPSGAVSEKGRKLAFDQDGDAGGNLLGGDDFFAIEEEEDDDFMDFSLDDFGDDSGGDGFGDDGGFGGGDDPDLLLPACSELNETLSLGNETMPCRNVTVEVRHPDQLLSRLLEQVWTDFQTKLNTEAAVGNMTIDPLDLDAQLPEPIDLRQAGGGYDAHIKMSGIKMHGLSSIRLDRAEVTRGENLTDLAADVRFAFHRLVINGTYSMRGHVGWWELDSNGTQVFSIDMTNATFSIKTLMDISSASAALDGSFSECDDAPGNARIRSIQLPLRYDDVNFDFRNLGAFANTVVNGVGVYFLQTQEEVLVKEVRAAIKSKFNSLIC